MKHSFGNHSTNFETQSQDIPDAAEFVVVLREPTDRWISGLAQHHHGNEVAWHLHYRNLGWDAVLSQVIFDNHTEHQTSFLQHIDRQRITWFEFGPDLTEDFYHWCQGRFDPAPCSDRQINALADQPALIPDRSMTGLDMLEEIRAVINGNSKYQQRLRDFYHKDYELYESAHFYRAR